MDSYQIRRFFQLGNGIAVIATILVNILANSLPLNGKFTGELSDAYPNLFVPAGITFAIWGVIYVLLILFGVYQFQDFWKEKSEKVDFVLRIGWLFILSGLANCAWIFLWHYEQVLLSLGAMLLLLVALMGIYFRLDIGRSHADVKEYFFIQIPISVYLGWITVATIANVTALLVDIKWNGFGIAEGYWTILVITVAVLLTCVILIKRYDIAYSLVVLWALLGIAIKRFSDDPLFGIRQDIGYAAVAGMIVISLFLSISIFLRIKKVKNVA